MTESSVPFILFHNQPVKVLRIILRDRFAADALSRQYYRRDCSNSIWEKCTYQSWYEGIYQSAKEYMHRYTDEVPQPGDINRASQYLYHRNIHNKIHGNSRGFSMA